MFNQEAGVGIIGGADGPVAVYLTETGILGAVNGWIILLAVVIAYCIGNISPSIIMAKARGLDIRKEGSGNAGTTNALRVMGKKAGVITLVVDILKGTCAVLLGDLIGGSIAAMLCVVAVFCGHVWPVVYRFKGGKGVATAFGALMGLNPLLGLSALGVVVIGVLISKRMSVGSILGAAAFPVLAWFLEPFFVLPGTLLALIVIVKHRANIGRLIRGEEPRMSIFEKKAESEQPPDSAEKKDRR